MTMHRLAALAATVVIAGGFVACGDDESASDEPTADPSALEREERQEERMRQREARQQRRAERREHQRKRERRERRRAEREAEQAAAEAESAAQAEPAENCTPGYDPCLPPASDYDCEGGSGDGPKYTGRVSVDHSHGDPYDLDRDGDGVGCES